MVAAPEDNEPNKEVIQSEEELEKPPAMTEAELRSLLREADGLAKSVISGTLDIRSDTHALSYEFFELITTMVSDKSISIGDVLKHPVFWDLAKKIQYLGEQVGNLLPAKVQRSSAATPCGQFVQALETLCDKEIGA